MKIRYIFVALMWPPIASMALAADEPLTPARIVGAGPNSGDVLLGSLKLGRRTGGVFSVTAPVAGPIDAATFGGLPLGILVGKSTYQMPLPSGSAANDAANFAAAQASAARIIIFQPGPGCYLSPPSGYPQLRSDQNLMGAAEGACIRLTGQAAYVDGILYGQGRSNITLSNLTLDYNNFRDAPLGNVGVISFTDGRNIRLDTVNILNFPKYGFVLNGGSDVVYNRGRITRASAPLDGNGAAIPLGRQNQCVLVSESTTNGVALRPVNRVLFQDISCAGSAFDVSGADIDYVRTVVDGFDFGSGFTTEQGPNSLRHRFWGARVYNGRTNPTTGKDDNATASGCYEIWSPGSVIDNSVCDNVGGEGVSLGGKNSRVTNSRFSRLGQQVYSAGITARWEGGGAFSADGSLISGNVITNDGPSYPDGPFQPIHWQDLTFAMTVRINGNDLGTVPMTIKGGNAKWGSPGMLVGANNGAYSHTPGSIRAPINVTIVGAVRKTDTIVGVTYTGNDGGALPAGLRAFGEVDADNSVKFYTQDVSGGSSNISVPAGTFTGRLITIN